MDRTRRVINELLVDVYNDVLNTEVRALRSGNFHDVSIKEVHTVEAIGLHREDSMGEIAKRLEFTVGTLTVAVNRLVKKGYVERVRSDQDRRVVRLRLTNRGRVLYRVHEQFHMQLVNDCIGDLTEDEGRVLRSALQKINDFFRKNYRGQEGEA